MDENKDSDTPPLAGLRVLELGSTAAGPFCARLLADFGADVIKVEDLAGDPVRSLGESVNGSSLYAASILRNKRLVSLDLRQPEICDIIRQAIPKFDIVVENFRPGGLEKWGLGYGDLSRINPQIILTRISGFGQTGSWSKKPGYGVIGEAISGLRDLIGDADRPPSRVAMPLTDYIAALYAAFGTMLAVRSRELTGRGQVVDATLFESAFSFMESSVPTFDQLGKAATRSGSKLPYSTPNNLYPTKDGDHIHIAALADRVFRRLVEAMGRPELADDPRFITQTGRANNEAEIESLVSEWTQSKSLEELESILDSANVPASRIYKMADIFESDLYREREMLVDVPDRRFGSIKLAGVVPRLSHTPGAIKWAGQDPGAHTRDVLRQEFELDEQTIDRLIARGFVGVAEQQSAGNETNAAN